MEQNIGENITTYFVIRMKTYIFIFYVNMVITVLFTWCALICTCVLLLPPPKEGNDSCITDTQLWKICLNQTYVFGLSNGQFTQTIVPWELWK